MSDPAGLAWPKASRSATSATREARSVVAGPLLPDSSDRSVASRRVASTCIVEVASDTGPGTVVTSTSTALASVLLRMVSCSRTTTLLTWRPRSAPRLVCAPSSTVTYMVPSAPTAMVSALGITSALPASAADLMSWKVGCEAPATAESQSGAPWVACSCSTS